MGGFSPVHMGLLLVIALLVFGPKKLPEIGRELGQAIREFKKASREVMESFHNAAEDRPRPAPYADAYASTVVEETHYPATVAPTSSLDEVPPAAAAPSVTGAPPPGTVERSAHAPVNPSSEPASAPPAAPAEPVHEPAAAAERNP